MLAVKRSETLSCLEEGVVLKDFGDPAKIGTDKFGYITSLGKEKLWKWFAVQDTGHYHTIVVQAQANAKTVYGHSGLARADEIRERLYGKAWVESMILGGDLGRPFRDEVDVNKVGLEKIDLDFDTAVNKRYGRSDYFESGTIEDYDFLRRNGIILPAANI